MSSRETTHAVIVGAGPAGLAVGACLRQADISFIMLERADTLAPAWRRHYDRLHLHTPKHSSALPFAPFPKDYPRYPSRDQIVAYLEAYAERFRLEPRCGEEVTSIERRGDTWVTTTGRTEYESQAVIVASGLHAEPHKPTWEGMGAYQGTLMHSSEYRNGDAFRGKDVLVVGLGNSGGEIAIDLWERGARPALSVRSPVNVIPRDLLGISIIDIATATSFIPPALTDVVFAPVLRLASGGGEKHGLQKPPYGAAAQVKKTGRIPLIDVGTMRLIRQGQVRVYPDIERFTGDGVAFTNGESRHFDAVILATGYRPRLDVLKVEGAEQWQANRLTLPTKGQEAPVAGLYFCGFASPVGGTLREIGIEARNIARSIAARRAMQGVR